MKKFLPLIIFGLGVLLFAGVFVMKSRGGKAGATPAPGDDEIVAEIPFEKRPFVTLTPTDDGHWLKMVIQGIKVDGAATLDYLVEYQVADGRSQGVPGEIEIEGEEVIERELLLGSESSGKFRYDEGVEKGTLTLRFRNDKGKLVGKLMTDFHLQTGTTELSTIDEVFKFELAKAAKGVYFITMMTFGVPENTEETKDSPNLGGPYGIFSSDGKSYPGTPTLAGDNIMYWDGSKWQQDNYKTGIYITQNASQ